MSNHVKTPTEMREHADPDVYPDRPYEPNLERDRAKVEALARLQQRTPSQVPVYTSDPFGHLNPEQFGR